MAAAGGVDCDNAKLLMSRHSQREHNRIQGKRATTHTLAHSLENPQSMGDVFVRRSEAFFLSRRRRRERGSEGGGKNHDMATSPWYSDTPAAIM